MQNNGYTPLIHAAQEGHFNIIQMIIEKDRNPVENIRHKSIKPVSYFGIEYILISCKIKSTSAQL